LSASRSTTAISASPTSVMIQPKNSRKPNHIVESSNHGISKQII
jgi:hypothetical protein